MTPLQRFFRNRAACGCLLDVVIGALLVLAVLSVR